MAWIGSVVLASGELRDLAIASTQQTAMDRARNLARGLGLPGVGIFARHDGEPRPSRTAAQSAIDNLNGGAA